MKRSTVADRLCPVARAAAQVADAWTFVILRELFLGNRRFEGLRRHTGMAPRSLSLRLAQLVDDAIVEKVAMNSEGAAAAEYRLTPKGLDLWPVIVTLRQWGERWAGPWGRGGTPLKLLHRGRDHALHAVLHCAECGEAVDARSGQVLPTPAALRERQAFAAKVDQGPGPPVARASPRRRA